MAVSTRLPVCPSGSSQGQARDCYDNARNLIDLHPGWLYVEGYGLADGRPYRHAWNVSDDGVTIDQIWPSPESKAYLGVQLDHPTLEAWKNRGSFHAVLSPLEWVAVMAWRRAQASTEPT